MPGSANILPSPVGSSELAAKKIKYEHEMMSLPLEMKQTFSVLDIL